MQEEDKKTEDTAETPTEEQVAPEAAPEADKAEEKEAEQPEEPAKEESKAEEKKPVRKVSPELEKIIKSIETMTVLELADLVKALEERFGVTAAAPMAIAAAPAAGGASGEAEAEGQTTFTVVLSNAGANKIGVIKAVREIVPTLGLKEAKDLVDGAPKPVVEGVGKEAANEAKTKLEAAGGSVALQ